jgi:UDPglucose--hexose-1-phosphate uridylyltransferase
MWPEIRAELTTIARNVILARMQLRKDPITRSWVITGDDPEKDNLDTKIAPCRFCPDGRESLQIVGSVPSEAAPGWSARSVVHPAPLYRIEGDPKREGDGIYDRMRTVGAHEVLIENPKHDHQLWNSSDTEIERFLSLAAQRIQDLKQDQRFKYVTVFKNHGAVAGQDFAHPTSQLTASTFVPRRVLHELRAGKDYYGQKERCVFCDILGQELRQRNRIVETIGDFVACCPYAPRAPYEIWILPQAHEASFERFALGHPAKLKDLANLLRRTLLRVRSLTEDFQMVLHTVPNTQHKSRALQYWKTIDDDYHWHIEILPILAGGRAKSYTFKEVYYTPVTPETAAARLRAVDIDREEE